MNDVTEVNDTAEVNDTEVRGELGIDCDTEILGCIDYDDYEFTFSAII